MYMSTRKLFTFIDFNDTHSETRMGGLRDQAFYENENGAKELQVFPKNGRRRYVDEDRYYLRIELENTGELDSVVKMVREAKAKGQYLAPEDAVAQIRGGAA
jgi:hypothetical protein